MKRTFIALTVAASTALAAPAMAGGTISFGYNAQNADEANAIRGGLMLYSIINDVKTNGHVTQNGINNAAALAQSGNGNRGIIHQQGNGHNASLNQTGNGNAYGVFQVGNGANAHVNQTGNGAAGILLQIGF